MNGNIDYSVYSKDFEYARWSGWWMRLKLWLFGERHVSRSGPWELVAYYYQDKWYITKYARWDQ